MHHRVDISQQMGRRRNEGTSSGIVSNTRRPVLLPIAQIGAMVVHGHRDRQIRIVRGAGHVMVIVRRVTALLSLTRSTDDRVSVRNERLRTRLAARTVPRPDSPGRNLSPHIRALRIARWYLYFHRDPQFTLSKWFRTRALLRSPTG